MSDTPTASGALIFYVAPPGSVVAVQDEDRRYRAIFVPRPHKGKGERKRNRRDRWR